MVAGDLPVMEQVYRVLYEGRSPRESIQELMQLPAGRDFGSPRRPIANHRDDT